MGKPGNKIHIPTSTNKALAALLKVKPTPDMPRPGAHPSKPKKRTKHKRSK